MGFWASLWILLKPVAREAAKDAASALIQKRLDKKADTGKNAKTRT